MRRLIALFCLLCLQASAEPMDFPGYRWDSPVKFGEVQEWGTDAFFALYPNVADTNQVTLELIVVHTPRESVATIQEAGANPRRATISMFLGIDGQPEQINKALFMGEGEARLVYSSRTPRPNTAHVFQKELENGALVTVALRDYGGNDQRIVGDILRALSQTFVAVY